MRIYPVKENTIGSAFSEILRYRHIDTQTDNDVNTKLFNRKKAYK